MIGIVVGVNLIAPVNDVVQTVTTPTYSSSVVSLASVLTIIFVTVIILGAVAWISRKLVPLWSNLQVKTSQIRGNLNRQAAMVLIIALSTLEPYLVGKKAQAQLMLEILRNHKKWARYTEEELEAIDILKAMKRESFGNPELNLSFQLSKCVETRGFAPCFVG